MPSEVYILHERLFRLALQNASANTCCYQAGVEVGGGERVDPKSDVRVLVG